MLRSVTPIHLAVQDPSNFQLGSHDSLGSLISSSQLPADLAMLAVGYNSPRSSVSLRSAENDSLRRLEDGRTSVQPGSRHSSPCNISDRPHANRDFSNHIKCQSSWGTDIPPPGEGLLVEPEHEGLEEVDLNQGANVLKFRPDKYAGNRLLDHVDKTLAPATSKADPETQEDEAAPIASAENVPLPDVVPSQRPHFQKWMNTLRRRNIDTKIRNQPQERPRIEESAMLPPRRRESVLHSRKKSSSFSSSAFVTAVKSASISLASLSVAPHFRTRRHTSGTGSEAQSTRCSYIGNIDSMNEGAIVPFLEVDKKTYQRAVQRRRILEELITSEESFVGDLKILADVFVNLLGTVRSVSQDTRAAIHRNIIEILELHELILGELLRAVPNSEFTQDDSAEPVDRKRGFHARGRSLDVDRGGVASFQQSNKKRHSMHGIRPVNFAHVGRTAEPEIVAKVARAFGRLMKQLFVYEEYSTKYERMVQDVASTFKTPSASRAFEMGIETLAASVTAINRRAAYGRKGLTFQDLLIKPVQRVCRYPLLFSELYKHTPACDCPASNAEIEKTLFRLRQVAQRVNAAKDDPQTRDSIERTWRLQDRLMFPLEMMPSHLFIVRLLGHATLCGILHVAWQNPTGVGGRYMACILFKSCLILSDVDNERVYKVVGCIDLRTVRIENTDSGKGLQCHTAPYSWKIIFESDQQMLEIIVSACSKAEEQTWKSSLNMQIKTERADMLSGESVLGQFNPTVTIDIKPLAQAFGQPGSVARRISVRRSSTVGARVSSNQVDIRNTYNTSESLSSVPRDGTINRSQSLLVPKRPAILSPKRSSRMRMERALCDVWTRQQLPYPGFEAMRGKTRMGSAGSIIRRISMASMAGSLTRRISSQSVISTAAKPSRSLRPTDHRYSSSDEDRFPISRTPQKLRITTPKLTSNVHSPSRLSPGSKLRHGLERSRSMFSLYTSKALGSNANIVENKSTADDAELQEPVNGAKTALWKKGNERSLLG